MRRPPAISLPRAGLALLVALLALAPVASVLGTAVGTAAAVPDARLQISGVTVTPDAPTTDEPVTVTATVQLSAGSSATAEIERVSLRNQTTTLARAEKPGSLSPGDSLTVDLVTAFGDRGRKELTLVAVANSSTAGETVRVRRPVTIVVRRSPPGLDVTVPDPVAGVESRVTVTVSNPGANAISDVEVTLPGPSAVERRASIPTLAAGATDTVNLSIRPERGEQALVVSTAYTTSTGARDVTRRRVVLNAPPLREEVGVAVTRVPPPEDDGGNANVAALVSGAVGLGGSGGSGALQNQQDGEATTERVRVAVTNFGNAPLENVVVRPRAGDRRLPRRYVGRLAPGETGTVTVDLSSVEESATVVAVANYTVAGTGPAGGRDADVRDADARARQGSARGTYQFRQPTGEIRVTDVSLSFTDDGRLRISGNAGNVGTAPVSGVVVAMGANTHVEPAYPGRTYFVGTVEGSEFAPFELTADVDAQNATELPIRVTYVVNGEERTRTVTLPYDQSLAPSERKRGGLFSLGAAPLAGLGVAAALAVAGPLLYRRHR
ncbi:MAG: CARDB domain-containing protein [Haloglomus sp.]